MNGAIVPRSVGSFTGEKHSVGEWQPECPLATFASDFHVAVGALRKGIRIPVVKITGGELRLQLGFFDVQNAAE